MSIVSAELAVGGKRHSLNYHFGIDERRANSRTVPREQLLRSSPPMMLNRLEIFLLCSVRLSSKSLQSLLIWVVVVVLVVARVTVLPGAAAAPVAVEVEEMTVSIDTK